jgi:Zn-dependent metalloprotease
MDDALALRTSLAYLEARAAELGIRDAQQEFRLRRIVRDGLGHTHVRLEQVYQGVQVWGRQLVVHLDPGGAPQSVTGAYLPGIAVSTHATLSSQQARGIAQQRFPGALFGTPETELVLYPQDGRVRLVFRVVLSDDATPRRMVVFVDATTGQLVDSYDDLRTLVPPVSGPTE